MPRINISCIGETGTITVYRNVEIIETSSQPIIQEIDYKEITDETEIGRGSYGIVKKAKCRDQVVAVKHLIEKSETKGFDSELYQWSRLCHPNIVTLFGACTQIPHVCLVTEFSELGSLHNLLHNSPQVNYTAGHVMSWAKQLAMAVSYLHNLKPKPLIHRDLKSSNLLLFKKGIVLKICDFGTAADLKTLMTIGRGTSAWMAPEVIRGHTYTEKCDVFSFGVIFWEMILRQMPFKKDHDCRIQWATVKESRRPPLNNDDCDYLFKLLVCNCWHQNPLARPTMRNVVHFMKRICEFYHDDVSPLITSTQDVSTNATPLNINSSENLIPYVHMPNVDGQTVTKISRSDVTRFLYDETWTHFFDRGLAKNSPDLLRRKHPDLNSMENCNIDSQ